MEVVFHTVVFFFNDLTPAPQNVYNMALIIHSLTHPIYRLVMQKTHPPMNGPVI